MSQAWALLGEASPSALQPVNSWVPLNVGLVSGVVARPLRAAQPSRLWARPPLPGCAAPEHARAASQRSPPSALSAPRVPCPDLPLDTGGGVPFTPAPLGRAGDCTGSLGQGPRLCVLPGLSPSHEDTRRGLLTRGCVRDTALTC